MTNTDDTARQDWEHRIGQRTAAETGNQPLPETYLPAPTGITIAPGVGHVTLRWHAVPGAMGYLVSRDDGAGGDLKPLDHGGGDVLAVPGCFYDDSLVTAGRTYRYAIASVTSPELPTGPQSAAVSATPRGEEPDPVAIAVDAQRSSGRIAPIWKMLGAEHLSEMFYTETTGGRPIGEELRQALEIAHRELGTTQIRAHAILNDEQGVYREQDGEPVYDFSAIDRIYDQVLALGIRPVVELSFMPRDLAANPDATVFAYKAIISPPKDWTRWAELIRRLTEHLVERYSVDEVRRWAFEIWNEPNLDVFWTGSQAEYFKLYDLAARAIKDVDDRLPVGGPATAAAEWIPAFLEFTEAGRSPVDFLSTHTYGNIPLDIREAARVRHRQDLAIFWTEWGVSPTHFQQLNDWPYGAPLLLHGMKQCQVRADALAHWVVSDHFEELGRPGKLFHGGFGLLTVGNLRKPPFWAMALANQLGPDAVAVTLRGDGAGTLVDAWATRHPDGTIDLLVWNGTLAQTANPENHALDRRLEIRISGLDAVRYQASLARIDTGHSNILRHWASDHDWPTAGEWSALHAADRLDERPLPDLELTGDAIHLVQFLPMPGVLRLRLTPSD